VLPVKAASYRNLVSIGKSLYYVRMGGGKPAELCLYNFDKRKETVLGNYGGFEISANKKKMMLGSRGSYSIVNLPKGKEKPSADSKLNLSNMKMKLDRHAEWTQIFNECWRQMKYFFYDPGMHGVDWDEMKASYEPLVKHVNHRADLTYIIGEMIGELNVGHAYVGGGEMPKAKKISLGLLGAEISRDKSGYFRIDKILKGQNWYRNVRSPLTEIGVDANEGDYIIAVDGISSDKVENVYELLIDKANKQVEITFSSSPNADDGRTSLVTPSRDESGLRYYDWVQGNIRKVSEQTNNRVGYIHIPDMGIGGLNEFMKYYYPQLRKEALIIDVRGNGGGFVSPMIIDRLNREMELLGYARNAAPSTSPGGTNTGPKVCLLDEFSASDGDIFPYRFRYHKLGPLIGKRSWGGVVGIRGSLPLLDGGSLNRPEFAHYNVEGNDWVVEGKGVEPDIVVDNDPAMEYAGIDQQLNRGIEEIKAQLDKGKGFKLNPPPPFPDKSK
jgi:tricorn protease